MKPSIFLGRTVPARPGGQLAPWRPEQLWPQVVPPCPVMFGFISVLAPDFELDNCPFCLASLRVEKQTTKIPGLSLRRDTGLENVTCKEKKRFFQVEAGFVHVYPTKQTVSFARTQCLADLCLPMVCSR